MGGWRGLRAAPRLVLACLASACFWTPSASASDWIAPVQHDEWGAVDNERPSARADAAGDLWATFRKGGDFKVAFRPAGGTWQDPPTSLGHGEGLVLAVDRAGNGVAAWQDDAGDIWASTHLASDDGTRWSDAVRLGVAGTLPGGGPDLSVPDGAMDDSGTAYVAWVKTGLPGTTAIKLSRFNGGSWAPMQDATPAGQVKLVRDEPRLAAAGDGWVVTGGKMNVGGGLSQPFAAVHQTGVEPWKPYPLGAVGVDTFSFNVDITQRGEVLAAWEELTGASTERIVSEEIDPGREGSTMPIPGAQFSIPSYDDQSLVRVSFTTATDGVVSWVAADPNTTKAVVQVSDYLGDGRFDPEPTTVSDPEEISTNPALAVNDAGFALLVFDSWDGSKELHLAATRQRTGAWSAPDSVSTRLSTTLMAVQHVRVSVDQVGDGITTWVQEPEGSSEFRIYTAAYDSGMPSLNATFPSSGTVGEMLPFSASVTDVWSAFGEVTWDFGDGGTATGPLVSHGYGSDGLKTVTAQVRDALGNVATRTATVAISTPHVEPQPPETTPTTTTTTITPPPPPPPPVVKIPPVVVAFTKAGLLGTWNSEARLRGTITIAGTAESSTGILVTLTHHEQTARFRFTVDRGRFTHTAALPGSLLPGTYGVDVTSTSSVTVLYKGPPTIRLAAPLSGIAARPYLTINGPKGVRALQVSPGARRVWVHFRFLARPARGQHIRLVWYRDGKRYFVSPKPNWPTVDSNLTLQPGVAHHNWRIDLVVGKTVVRQLSFRWR